MHENVVYFVRLNPTTAIDLNNLHFVSGNTETNKTVDQSSNLTISMLYKGMYDAEEIGFARFDLNIGERTITPASFSITQCIDNSLIAR